MSENGRRAISDVGTLRRFAHDLGLPPHVLGTTGPQDADIASMIQFGESTVRLASVARQAGHSAAAINELWPLIGRLESRAATGHANRDAMRLLGRARRCSASPSATYCRRRSWSRRPACPAA